MEDQSNNDFWRKKVWPVAGWVAWIVTAFFLGNIVVALGIIILVMLGLLSESWLDDGVMTTTVISVAMYLMILLIALSPWLIGKRKSTVFSMKKPSTIRAKKRKTLAKLVGLSRPPKWDDLKKFLMCVPMYYGVLLAASLVLSMVLMAFLGGELATEILGQEQDVGYATNGQSVWQLILIGLMLVGVAPVAEEMLMRGFLFGQLRKYLSFWPVAIIVSLLFAVAHWHVAASVMTFILSMFACGLREKTGAIWAGIGLHMFANGLAFTLRFVVGVG